ncbi:MAG: 3'-5' exonuclease [Desulfonatronovibrionaceae bacterium]
MFIKSRIKDNITRNWPAIMSARAKKASDPRLKHFYQAYKHPCKTPLNKLSFTAVDFETTGLNPEQDEIVSIGLIPFDLKTIYSSRAAHWLVKPAGDLDQESIVIHGITHSDIHKAPDLLTLLERLLQILAGKIIVVHYHRIERDFLNKALKDRLGEGIQFPVIDTMAIESTLEYKRAGRFWKRLAGHKPGSVRLAASRERYGLPAYPPHNALTDALATAELFQAQVAHHFSPGTYLGRVLV